MTTIDESRYIATPDTTGAPEVAPSAPRTPRARFDPERLGERLRAVGTHVTRYGLVVVLVWIGGMEFTAYDAEGIRPLVANSSLTGWATTS